MSKTHVSVFIVISTGCVCLTSNLLYGVFIYICLLLQNSLKMTLKTTQSMAIHCWNQHQISAVNVRVSSDHESLDSSMPHSLVARQDNILVSDHSYKSSLTSLFTE